MGIKALQEFQIGKETTWGTPVAPTAKLMGVDIDGVTLQAINEVERLRDLRGSLAPAFLVVQKRIGATGRLPFSAVTYEDFPYILDSLFGVATPGGAGPFTRDYSAPLATQITPRYNTFVYGDGTDVYGMEGGLVSRVVVSGEEGGPWKAECDLIGEKVATDELESLSDRTVAVVMGDHTKLYIDAVGGTIGATEIASTAFSFSLTVTPSRQLKRHLGNLYPAVGYDLPWDAELSLSLEFTATTKAYLDSVIASSLQHQVRIAATTGAGAAAKELRFDLAGVIREPPVIFTDREGLCTLDLVYDAIYNSTLANYLKAYSENGVAALP